MPMFKIRGTHLRSLVVFLWCKRRSTCEDIQRDDVTLWVWNTLSVSELTLPTFMFCLHVFRFVIISERTISMIQINHS